MHSCLMCVSVATYMPENNIWAQFSLSTAKIKAEGLLFRPCHTLQTRWSVSVRVILLPMPHISMGVLKFQTCTNTASFFTWIWTQVIRLPCRALLSHELSCQPSFQYWWNVWEQFVLHLTLITSILYIRDGVNMVEPLLTGSILNPII